MDAIRLAQMLKQMPEFNDQGYDEAGYVAKYGVPAPFNDIKSYQEVTGNHLNDEFKMPNHPTFSGGSKYSAPDIQGGNWQSGGLDRWNFQPSKVNLQNMSNKDLADYFANQERKNTFATMPNGMMTEGKW
jgi:hypothetical protein